MAKWKGRAKLRRMLRSLPDDAREEIADVFQSNAPSLLAYARASTPVKTGTGRNLLKVRVRRRQLQMAMGLFGRLGNLKSDARRGFYLNILDRGRRPQIVRAKRQSASGVITRYAYRVKAIPDARYDIVFGRVRAHAMNTVGTALRDLWPRVLRRYSGGDYGD
jgi:hypothetical protein